MIELGPFTLLRPMARGGMGEVWLGLHRFQHRDVAIKVITSLHSRTEKYIRAFRREVHTMAMLDHPSIIAIFDYGLISASMAQKSMGRLIEKSPYLVMEWAPGRTLLDLIPKLAWPQIKLILLDILDALAHAHARGVIHRDLKPENVLIFPQSKGIPLIKLTDFGLAHSLDLIEQDPHHTSTVGTPAYMAPEQLLGQWRDYGPWTDLYSLGCLAYQMATSYPPYTYPDVHRIFQAHLHDPIPGLFARIPVPRAFETWIHRLLAKAPKDRFQNAAEAAWALFHIPDDPPKRKSLSPQAVLKSSAFAQIRQTPTLALEKEVQGISLTSSMPLKSTPLLVSEQTQDVHLSETPRFSSLHLSSPYLWPASSKSKPLLEFTSSSKLPLPASWRKHSTPSSLQLMGAGLGLFGLKAIPMVNRFRERDAIWNVLTWVEKFKQPRAVLIHGSAGTGKSRLVEWIAERAQEVGVAHVLKAVHTQDWHDSHPLAHMLARDLRTMGLSKAELVLRLKNALNPHSPNRRVDVQVLTKFLSSTRAWEDPLQSVHSIDESFDYHAALKRYLLYHADDPLLIVWLDDVQWGYESLNFLRYFFYFQTQTPAKLLFLLTVNDDDLCPEIQDLLDDIQKLSSVSSLSIDHLSRRDHLSLIQQVLRLDQDLAQFLVEKTAGNPLFALQIIDHWIKENALELKGMYFSLKHSVQKSIPEDIFALWQRRLDQLKARFPKSLQSNVQRALELAAVLGPDVRNLEWHVLASMASIHIPQNLHALLIRHGLAKHTDLGWAFVHNLLLETIERHAIERGQWKVDQALAAQMIEPAYRQKKPGAAQRYAMHLLKAGLQRQALDPILEAAQSAAFQGRWKRAQELIQRRKSILSSLQIEIENSLWIQTLVFEAGLMLNQGLLDQASEILTQIHISHDDDYIALADVFRLQATIAEKKGLLQKSLENLQEALRLYRKTHALLGMAYVYADMGSVALARRDTDRAFQHFQTALALFEDLGHPTGMGLCFNGLAEACRQISDFERALEMIHRAIQLFEKDHNSLSIATCINDLGHIARTQHQWDKAEAYYRQALQHMEAIDFYSTLIPQNHLALLALARHNFDYAFHLFEILLSTSFIAERPVYHGILHIQILPCLIHREDWMGFDFHLEKGLSLLEQIELYDEDLLFAATLAEDMAIQKHALERADKIRAWRKDYEKQFVQNS